MHGPRVLAQEDDRIDALLDSLFMYADDDMISMLNEINRNHSFIYARSGYDSKTTYAGREIGNNQYNISGQLFYMNSNGLYAGVSGAWYSQMEPAYNSTVLTAGYGRSLKSFKPLRLRITYNRYIYTRDTALYDAVYTGSISAGFSYKAKNIGVRAGYTLLTGSEFGSQASATVLGDFTVSGKGKKVSIAIAPEASFYFGSETVEYERYIYLTGQGMTPGDSDISYTDKFGLMNSSIYLPLEISFGDLDVEIGYIYNINRSLDPDYTYANNSGFMVSIGYIFMVW